MKVKPIAKAIHRRPTTKRPKTNEFSDAKQVPRESAALRQSE